MTTPDPFGSEDERAANALVSRAFRDVLREEKAAPLSGPTGFAEGNDASSFEPVWSHAPVSPEPPARREDHLIPSQTASPFTGGTGWLTEASRGSTPGYGARPYFLEHLTDTGPLGVPHGLTVPLPLGYHPASATQAFPLLNQPVNGHQPVWLDNAATTQKPLHVINAISPLPERGNSNLHPAAPPPPRRTTHPTNVG